MGEPSVEIDVLFVGQTGVGKSTLINMIMGLPDNAALAAKVSGDSHPCTPQTTPYFASLGTGLRCRLWDTRGLGEAVERSLMTKIVDWIRKSTHQQERELESTIRDRTKTDKPIILMWCIEGTKIDVAFHWQQFRKVYDFCPGGKAIPAIVITRMGAIEQWESKCTNQLQQLGFGVEPDNTKVHLLRVMEHKRRPSIDYTDDCKLLRDFISSFMKPAEIGS